MSEPIENSKQETQFEAKTKWSQDGRRQYVRTLWPGSNGHPAEERRDSIYFNFDFPFSGCDL